MNWKCMLVIFYCLFQSSNLIASSPKINLYAFASEPIAYYEKDQQKGIFVDILQEVGRQLELGENTLINITPYKRLLKSLSNNQNGYIVTILYPNPEIIPFVTLSLPIMTFKNTIISLRQTPLNLLNLPGKNIAALRGSKLSFGEDVSRMLSDNTFNFMPVNRAIQGINLLFFRRIDGYLGPEMLHTYWLNKRNCQSRNEIAEPLVLSYQTAHLMISAAPNIPSKIANETIKKIENTMQTLINNKFIETTFAHYISNNLKCTSVH